MLVKILFWGAVLCTAVGVNSPDGNLFFFCAAHLTMLTIGLSLFRRDKRVRSRSTAKTTAPTTARKAKSA
jgi:hypothetical protein